MSKLLILLATLVGLTSAGILDRLQRNSLGRINPVVPNTVREVRVSDSIIRMSSTDLMRQKFLLRILDHVHEPLTDVETQNIPDAFVELAESYHGSLGHDMMHLLELWRNGQLLGKLERYTVSNPEHVRQMVGLTHLLVRSKDWEIFVQNARCARNHMNDVLFVNAVLLAVREREDTRHLILPGIHDILPQLFVDSETIRIARNIDINLLTTSSVHDTHRPSLLDMIGLGGRANRMDSMVDRRSGWGRLGLLLSGNRNMMDETISDNIVQENLSTNERSMKLLTEDVGFKGFLHNIINDLCLKENELSRVHLNMDVGVNRVRMLDRHVLNDIDSLNLMNSICRQCITDRNIEDCNRCVSITSHDDLVRLGENCVNCMRHQIDMDCNMCQDRVNRNRIVDTGSMRRGMMMHDTGLQKLSIDCKMCIDRRIVTDCNTCLVNTDTEILRSIPRDCVDCMHHRIDEDCDMCLRSVKSNIRSNGVHHSLSGMLRSTSINSDLVRDLPTTTISDDRLLHVNHKKLSAMNNIHHMGNILENENGNSRDRFMNVVNRHGVNDGRKIKHTDDIDVINRINLNMHMSRGEDVMNRHMLNDMDILDHMGGKNRNRMVGSDNMRPGMNIHDIGMNRLSIECMRCIDRGTVTDCSTCLMRTDIEMLHHLPRDCVDCIHQKIEQNCNMCQSLLENDISGNGIQHGLNGMLHDSYLNLGVVKDLPTTSINDDRLLHKNRKKLFSMNGVNLNDNVLVNEKRNIREHFINIVHGHEVDNGRKIKQTDDVSMMDRMNLITHMNRGMGVVNRMDRVDRNRMVGSDSIRRGIMKHDIGLHRLNIDCMRCLDRRTLTDCNACLMRTDIEILRNLPRDCIDCIHHRIDQNCNMCQRLVENDIRGSEIQNDLNGMLHDSRINLDLVRDLPTTSINDDRLLHVNRKRLSATKGVNRMDKTLGNEDQSTRQRFMNVVHRHDIENGHKTKHTDDMTTIDQTNWNMHINHGMGMTDRHVLNDMDILDSMGGMNHNRMVGSVNTRPGMTMHDIGLNRLSIECMRCIDLRSVTDCNTCLMRTDIEMLHRLPRDCVNCVHHRIEQNCNMCQRLVENDIRGNEIQNDLNGMLHDSRINLDLVRDLPTTSINDDRLLHVNHKRLSAIKGVNRMDNTLGNQNRNIRQRFINVVEGGDIDDGHKIKHTVDMTTRDRMNLNVHTNSGMGLTDRHMLDGMNMLHRSGGMNRNRMVDSDNMRRGMTMHDIGLHRLGVDCMTCIGRRADTDCNTCLMRTDIEILRNLPRDCVDCIHHRTYKDCDMCQRLVENDVRGNGIHRDSNGILRDSRMNINLIRDLPTASINSDRLLHVNRKKLASMVDSKRMHNEMVNEHERIRARVMNEMHGNRIDNVPKNKQTDDLSRIDGINRQMHLHLLGTTDDMYLLNHVSGICRKCIVDRNRVDCDKCTATTPSDDLIHLGETCITCIRHQADVACNMCTDRYRLGSTDRMQQRMMMHNNDNHELLRDTVRLNKDCILCIDQRTVKDCQRCLVNIGTTDMHSLNGKCIACIYRQPDMDCDTCQKLLHMDRPIMDKLNPMHRSTLIDVNGILPGDDENIQRMNDHRLSHDYMMEDIWGRQEISNGRKIMHRDEDHELILKSDVLLHNLQQLLARINLERLSLGLDTVETMVGSRTIDMDDRKTLNLPNSHMLTTDNVVGRMTGVIGTDAQHILDSLRLDGHMNDIDVDSEIARILMGRDSILKILTTSGHHDSMQTLHGIGIDINDATTLKMLRQLMQMVDDMRTRILGSYKHQDLVLNDVKINDIVVDKLVTRIEDRDIDMRNMLDDTKKNIVIRKKQLTHNDFRIKIDVNSERNQRVVVRTLIGPKRNDDMGREITLNERRAGFMLLDAKLVDLTVGRNIIERRSRDIRWTARDTTPLTKIYERIMMVEEDSISHMDNVAVGQDCRFPHRLILPRGRTDGLDMELLVLITPVEGDVTTTMINDDRMLKCGMGINMKGMDRRSLGFPLDRHIEDLHDLPLNNMRGVNVKIFHEDHLNTKMW